jgi:hypothetical protein
MRPFLSTVATFIALQLVIAAVCFQIGRTGPDNYLGGIVAKERRLSEGTEPRVILLGDSNVGFGIQSDIIKDATQRDVVNFGTHAGLGLDYALNAVSPHLRAGDTVVVSYIFESLATDLANGEVETVTRLLFLSPSRRQYFGEALTAYNSKILGRDGLRIPRTFARQAIARIAIPDFDLRTRNVASGFVASGDWTAHYGVPQESEKIHEFCAPIDSEILNRSIRTLNSFNEACREKGTTVVFSHAPTTRENYEKNGKELRELHQTLVSRLNFPVIDKPGDLQYDRELFFDSRNHLTEEGGQLRSHLVGNSLARLVYGNDVPRTAEAAVETGTAN